MLKKFLTEDFAQLHNANRCATSLLVDSLFDVLAMVYFDSSWNLKLKDAKSLFRESSEASVLSR